ncbi:MAG: hypothetical protein PHF84_04510 [bacterium]|nr:hypothetical protein [bacterium]
MADKKINYIFYKAIERFRDDKYRIYDAQEPRYQYEKEKKVWHSPRGTLLEEIAVETGWFRIYHSKEEKLFWLMEIEGPDHGVHFYGPFRDTELPPAEGS